MEWLTGKTVPQAILLPTLLLLMAVAAALLACGPAAEPAQEEDSPQLTAQTISETLELTKETQKPQVTESYKTTPLPGSKPTTTAQADPTPDQEPTATAPTPEVECMNEIVRELEGKTYVDCLPAFTIPPTPKYSIVSHRINKFLLAAEQAAKTATDVGPTESETHKVFVKIETRSETDTIAIVKWLENSRVRRYDDRTKDDIGSIHSSDGHPYNYIYANIPVYLLIPLIHQEGITKIEDGCLDEASCHTQYPRNYIE